MHYFSPACFRRVQLSDRGHDVQETDLLLHHHHLHSNLDDRHGVVDVLLVGPQIGNDAIPLSVGGLFQESSVGS